MDKQTKFACTLGITSFLWIITGTICMYGLKRPLIAILTCIVALIYAISGYIIAPKKKKGTY